MSPNIVVFFSDDHAQWALPSYGNSEIIAPALDYLAETGAQMNKAFTPCPVCSPARASFWTGLYPSQHGVHDHLAEDDAAVQATDWLADIPTLAERLQAAGYSTALCGKWHCGAGESPKSGFDYWYSAWRRTPKNFGRSNLYSDQGLMRSRRGQDTRIINEAALDFLRNRDTGKPFFLFVGYATTHNPWIDRAERLVAHYRHADFRDIPHDLPYPFGIFGDRPSPPADAHEARAQYYAAVSMIDEGVGALLDELDAQEASDNTLVVYTSDHGLNLGHHGIWGKGNGSQPLNMLDESIRVPLICKLPRVIPAGARRDEFLTHCDLFMTLLDFAGARPEDSSDYPGRSFRSLLQGEGADWPDCYFGEYGTTRVIRDRHYKLVKRYAGGENLLHDMLSDPRETVNLYEERAQQPIVKRLTRQLEAFFARYEKPSHSGLRGDDLPVHNRREAWRSVPAVPIDQALAPDSFGRRRAT
ncbi:MAG: sulfatase-like hydrolase/transferase [Chloroflexi bacterium]|nr:sulfatase-like hydrolase/transferase [Chloroflexota bacterium]